MPFDIQNLVVGAAVLFAASYLSWRGIRLVRAKGAGGCGSSCRGCPTAAPVENAAVVQITKKR